jgi:6-phosphogluconolactonase
MASLKTRTLKQNFGKYTLQNANRFFGLLMLTTLFSTGLKAQHSQQNMDIAKKVKLYVGTFSVRGSEGIYVYNWNLETGDFEPIQTVPGRESPSFLAIHPTGEYLYSVNREGLTEGEESGSVASYRIDANSGQLTFLNEVSSLGAGPCHVQTDLTGQILFVSNYSEGNFTVYSVEEDGRIGENLYNFAYEGQGPNLSRQQKPHLHSALPSPDNRFVFAADLGTDRLYAYRIKPGKGKLRPAKTPWVSIKPGGGPRHFTFHPNGQWVYVAEELSAHVTALRYDDRSGAMEEIQRLSTLPAGFSDPSYCADIHVHPSGRFLYVSNRGHQSLAIYAIDQATGKLTMVDTPSVQGDWPRNFLISPDGRWCLVANERSDTVAVFSIDQQTGKLTFTGRELKIPSPVCLKILR